MNSIINGAAWISYPVLFLHVASGFIGMYGGFVPLFTRKGGISHRRWGLVFVWGMAIAAVTAFPLAFWSRDIFQATIGLLSGYLVLMSVRSLHINKAPRPSLDWSVAFAGTFAFMAMIGAGIVQFNTAPSPQARASIVFGALGLIVCARQFMALTTAVTTFRQRVLDHMLASCLALTCGVASFLNTQLGNLTGLDWPLDWRMLFPVICAIPILTYFLIRWSRKLRGVESVAGIVQAPESSETTRFRFFARAEGISLLVLMGIAVPLKHFGGHPELVRLMGPVHGALFVLYVIAVMLARRPNRWTTSVVIWAILASIVPGGTFIFDALLRRRNSREINSASVGQTLS